MSVPFSTPTRTYDGHERGRSMLALGGLLLLLASVAGEDLASAQDPSPAIDANSSPHSAVILADFPTESPDDLQVPADLPARLGDSGGANATEDLQTKPPSLEAVTEGKYLADSLSFPLTPLVDATSSFMKSPGMAFGKNSFLTGFGLGFLAFGLKKLLLPLFIGAQIVKSVLVALFLPTILSGIGKLVGKGLTNVASQSGSSGGQEQMSDFDFKDPGVAGYDTEPQGSDTIGTWAAPSQAHATLAALNSGRNPAFMQPTKATAAQTISERYTPKLPSLPLKHTGSFYSKDPAQDYKVFQKIPSSSHLLTHYDPFYSPLLSRLDAVYQQLGTTSEGCRERLVCDMYSNPAKFAPFSNLVSAQLSRELNELRKPSSDNPEILRFFRYMKAAKDGQDGARCDLIHNNCIAPTTLTDASPMVTTFNDINKLVQARALKVA